MKKMTPKRVRFWSGAIIAAGLFIMLARLLLDTDIVTIAGFLITVGGVIFHFLCYRCPHCGAYLDRNGGDYCPFCGKELEKEGE